MRLSGSAYHSHIIGCTSYCSATLWLWIRALCSAGAWGLQSLSLGGGAWALGSAAPPARAGGHYLGFLLSGGKKKKRIENFYFQLCW